MRSTQQPQTDFRLAEKPEFWVVGIGSCGPFNSARQWVRKMWAEVVARAGELPASVDTARYVCPNHGRATEFTYYIGFEVAAEITDLPDGFACIKIPAHTYAVGTAQPTREDIYTTLPKWATAQGRLTLKDQLWLEIYPQPPSEHEDGPHHFEVWLPVATPPPASDGGSPGPLGAVTHVQLPVPDIDAAAAWYAEHLGFTLYRRAHDDLAILALPSGPTLFLWKTTDQTTANFTRNGEVMPAIGISCSDTSGLRDRLLAAGVEISHFAEESIATFLKFYDPYGNMLVVHQDRT